MSEALVPFEQNLPDPPGEITARAFQIWVTRGRGWNLFDFPVEPEPPFCPLYLLVNQPELPISDDGRKHGFLSGWLEGFKGSSKTLANAASDQSNLVLYQQQINEYQSLLIKANEPVFCQYYNSEFVELQLVLPKDLKVVKIIAENLLLSFSYLSYPISFEIIGNEEKIIIQFACTEKDASQVKQQISSHLPNCFIKETSGTLIEQWLNSDPESLIVDFGLSNEFFYPLKTISHFEIDYLMTVIGALSNLEIDEIGVFQILFQKAKQDWASEIIESVRYLEETNHYHKSANALHFAKEKVKAPLFAVNVRVAAKSLHESRTWQIVKSLSAGLVHLSNPLGNELIPLSNENYPAEYHEQALLDRLSFRSGMLLNLDELVSLVHLPSGFIQSEKLPREMEQTKAAPTLVRGHSLVLGENFHQNETKEVSLSENQRTRHIHLIGSSGSGKSSLLLNLIKQDLDNRQGFCVIDPHGDLIEQVLGNIPASRVKDVVLFDPSDNEFPVGFNILQANSELEKNLLSSDLVATFRRMSTSWGDVMDSVLANAILAFVESERGGTLFDLKRFLVEKSFRNEFLGTVKDEAVRYFWENEFPLIQSKPQSSILIRLDVFLRQRLIRNIVCQKENKLDFRKIMDNRKVLLIKLSQGLIGEENAYLLGTLLVSKLYQTALSRQETSERPFFSCYLDEFHHFITPSMESILSGVRKYNLGLVLAHQEFRQLQSRNSEVASSVLSNCYTRICFRLGDADAEKFASGFSFFNAKNLQNLGIGEAIGRVERAEYDFNFETKLLPRIEREIAEEKRKVIIEESRRQYGSAKDKVEAELFPKSGPTTKTATPKSEPKEVKQSAPKSVSQEPKPVPSIVSPEEKTIPLMENVPQVSPESPLPSGKASSQHRYLQSLVKKMAENKGFLVHLEKEVFGGAGKIDAVLEREEKKFAVEISVTNDPNYELQNIQKCLSAGFVQTILISADRRHLEKIKQKAEGELPENEFEKLLFFSPEEFHLWLENLPKNAEEKNTKIKGFKVKVKLNPVEEKSRSSRQKAINEIVFGGLKKIKKNDSEE